jgi:acyl homoserine lactone synthase
MTIRYISAADLDLHPALAAAMFRDRTAQFRDRLGWTVTVDALGWETDGYDRAEPVYVVAEDAQGGHAGSLRLLPTTGPNMLAEIFPHLTAGPIRDPAVWETTRFCLAPGAGPGTARLLMAAISEFGLGLNLTHTVGVFADAMIRVYRRLGWEPELLGRADGVSAGIWRFDDATHDLLCAGAGVTPAQSRAWFEAGFPDIVSAGPLPVRAPARH